MLLLFLYTHYHCINDFLIKVVQIKVSRVGYAYVTEHVSNHVRPRDARASPNGVGYATNTVHLHSRSVVNMKDVPTKHGRGEFVVDMVRSRNVKSRVVRNFHKRRVCVGVMVHRYI